MNFYNHLNFIYNNNRINGQNFKLNIIVYLIIFQNKNYLIHVTIVRVLSGWFKPINDTFIIGVVNKFYFVNNILNMT